MNENPSREDREQFQELLKQFENLKNGRGNSFLEEDAFEKIIDYFQEQEKPARAMEAAEMGIDQYPYSSLLLIKKADILIGLRRYRDSLDTLEQVALLDSRDINLYILKTDALLALDQPEKAARILEEALELFSGDEKIEMLFELSDVYDDYEEFDKVFDCLAMVLQEEPNNEEALYKICFWTDFTGRNEEGIKLHQRIIDEYPYNELAWFNLAAAYQGIKLYEKAIDAYQYAITINEKFDYAWRNMGDAYIRLRKYKEAIEALEKVDELSKPEDVIYEAIGHCYDKMKNYAQARFYYRKASHLREDDSKLFYKMALTYFNESAWDPCMRQIDTAMKMNKHHAEYFLLAGECQLKRGAYKEASQYFLDVVRLRPKSTGGWEALVRCLFKAGLYEDALEQSAAALLLLKNKPIFLFYRAAVLSALGKNKEALLQLEEAMALAPKLLRRAVELHPPLLRNPQVVDLLARYKRNRSI